MLSSQKGIEIEKDLMSHIFPPSDEKNFPPPSITRTHRIVATQTLFPFFHSTILSSSRCIQSLPTTSTTTTWSLNPSQTSTSPSASRHCSWRAPLRKLSFQPYPNDTVAKMANFWYRLTKKMKSPVSLFLNLTSFQ